MRGCLLNKGLLAALHLLGAVRLCQPVMWEKQFFSGQGGPQPRFGHGAFTLDFPSGVLYVYGGLVVDAANGRGAQTANDVWMFDTGGQSWEKAAQEIEGEGPKARAFFSMVGIGQRGLVCGGSQSSVELGPSSSGLLADPSGHYIDCWWLTPSNYLGVKWRRVLRQPGSVGPQPRSGHTMTFDATSGSVVLWGGLGNQTALGDCWFLRTKERLSHGAADPIRAEAIPYAWYNCGNVQQAPQNRPFARWGHTAVFFQSRLYIQGGFSNENAYDVRARSDMWMMRNFENPLERSWDLIHPLHSHRPSPRAFHAAWLAGLKLCIVGGQGAGGTGLGSVLDQTWCYDLVQNAWSLIRLSPHTPVRSHLAVVPFSNGAVIAFGGQDVETDASNDLFEIFSSEFRWRRIFQSGTMPSRRAGHVSFFNQKTSEMIVALGQSTAPGSKSIQNDLWVFDLNARVWQCIHGGHPSCQVTDTAHLKNVPEPAAFASSTMMETSQLGVVFGGFAAASRASPQMTPVNLGRMYTLELAGSQKYQWREVITKNRVSPSARGLAALESLSPLWFGGSFVDNPVLLFGGADWSCFIKGCTFPTPFNDLWLLDVTPKTSPVTPSRKLSSGQDVSGNPPDQTARFDGVDDLVIISLPAWCHEPQSVGVIFIDFWMRYTRGFVNRNSYLVEALSGSDVQLQWLLEGDDNGLYVCLVLLPGDMQQRIRRWGPIQGSMGIWHHVTFTLRTAPVFNAQSVASMLIVQSFFFLDFVQVPIVDFADEVNKLILNKGLSHIYLGGSVTVQSSNHWREPVFFEGEIDDFRVWWRPCPIPTDPSVCNPYAFSLPKLNNGTIIPAARRADGRHIHEHDVEFDDIAHPVKVHVLDRDRMRLGADAGRPTDTMLSDGLILHLDFNVAPALDGKLLNSSSRQSGTHYGPLDRRTLQLPSYCNEASSQSPMNQSSISCPSCTNQCLYSKSLEFVASSIESSWLAFHGAEEQAYTFFSEHGWCECQDAKSCPRNGQCNCPSEYARVCNDCVIEAICSYGPLAGHPCILGEEACSRGTSNYTGQGRCVALDPFSCPESMCRGWTCKKLLFVDDFEASPSVNASHLTMKKAQEAQVSSDGKELVSVEICSQEVEQMVGNDCHSSEVATDAYSSTLPEFQAPFACTSTQTLIHAEEGKRRCCALVQDGGVLRGQICRRWSTLEPCVTTQHWRSRTNFSCKEYVENSWCDNGYGPAWDSAWGTFEDWADADGIDASLACCECREIHYNTSVLTCELPVEPSFQHDCGVLACCVDTNLLTKALQLEKRSAEADEAVAGCYTLMSEVYVGEDDTSPPPPVSKCLLPEGSKVHKFIDRSTKFQESWSQSLDSKLENAFNAGGGDSDGTGSGSVNEDEEDLEGSGCADSGGAASGSGSGSTGCHRKDIIELSCTLSPGKEEDVVMPGWVQVCRNRFGYSKKLPPSNVEFVVAFKDPIGPLTNQDRQYLPFNSPGPMPSLKQQQLANLVKIIAGMVGIHRSERHLVSIRQLLQTKTGQLRALARISTLCPAGAIHLEKMIRSQLYKTPCVTDPDWKSSTNVSCKDYVENSWCDNGYGPAWDSAWGTFEDWADADGIDASLACCECNERDSDSLDSTEGTSRGFQYTNWEESSRSLGLPESVAGAELSTYCGDGVVQADEECDDGTGNGKVFRCSAGCACNQGYKLKWTSFSGGDTGVPKSGMKDGKRKVCECDFETDFHASASESTAEVSAPNEITVNLKFSRYLRGAAATRESKEGIKSTPVEIEIFNLTGSLLTDGVIQVSCESRSWSSCHIGVPNIIFSPPDEHILISNADSLLDATLKDIRATIANGTEGVDPRTVDHWRKNSAVWIRKSGTLKFFVLQDLPPGELLRVNFTITNSPLPQPPRIPQVKVCSKSKAVDNGAFLLASNRISISLLNSTDNVGSDTGNVSMKKNERLWPRLVKLEASPVAPLPVCASFPCNYTLRAKSESGRVSTLAHVYIASPPIQGSVLTLEALTTTSRFWTKKENLRLKYNMNRTMIHGSVVSAADGCILKLWWSGNASDVSISLVLDQRTARTQAGCHTVYPSDRGLEGHMKICLGGEVGLVAFNPIAQEWSSVSSFASNFSQALTATLAWEIEDPKVEQASAPLYVTAAARSKCCSGHSCGDAICPFTTPTVPVGQTMSSPTKLFSSIAAQWGETRKEGTFDESLARLGGGTITRMPIIRPSLRPSFSTVKGLQDYVIKLVSNSSAVDEIQPQSNWVQACPMYSTGATFSISTTTNPACPTLSSLARAEIRNRNLWPAARFFHAMSKLGTGSVLIYGGVGCIRFGRFFRDEFCVATEVLDDVWQFDATDLTFEMLHFNPKLFPAYGHILVNLPGLGQSVDSERANLISFGGSKLFSPNESLWNVPRKSTLNSGATDVMEDGFVISHIYSARKQSAFQIVPPTKVGPMWGGSVVTNWTHAIVFGGFVGGALSNAVYVYDLTGSKRFQGHEMEKMFIAMPRPSARTRATVSIVNETFALWTGGVFRHHLSNRLLSRTDIWMLPGDSTGMLGDRLRAIPGHLPTNIPSFAGAFAFEVHGYVLLVLQGGISRGSQVENLDTGSPLQLDGLSVFLLGKGDEMILGGVAAVSSSQLRSVTWVQPRQRHHSFHSEPSRVGELRPCALQARYMHSATRGAFLYDDGVIVYGGVDYLGTALSDLWFFDIGSANITLITTGLNSDSHPDSVSIPMWRYMSPHISHASVNFSNHVSSCSSQYHMKGIIGPRHGHVAVAIPRLKQMKNSALLIYGGESTDLRSNYPRLSTDVHVATFQNQQALIQQPIVADMNGRPCGSEVLCPAPRRDAAALLITTANNYASRLFIHGGLANIDGSRQSPLKSYLSGKSSYVKALDDLWYLDLSDLNFGCQGEGYSLHALCDGTIVRWVQVTSRTEGASDGLGRFGASLLRTRDALLVIGGTSIQNSQTAGDSGIGTRRSDDSAGLVFVDDADMYAIQLQTASKSSCKFLRPPSRVQAGTTILFRVLCYDLLGRSTHSASISADMRSSNRSEILLEASCYFEDGSFRASEGAFVCRVTAQVAGLYLLSVFVTEIGVIGVTNRGTLCSDFPVTVEAGSTWWARSEIKSETLPNFQGTAGRTSNFMIVARDFYGNFALTSSIPVDFVPVLQVSDSNISVSSPNALSRRWGNDDVRAFWTASSEIKSVVAAAAETTDEKWKISYSINSQGTYQVTFWISQSGSYSIHVCSPSGLSIVGPPYILRITSSRAVVKNSYVYGQIEYALSGSPALLYVQTRDEFGNKVNETESYEDIEMNLCLGAGSVRDEACGGMGRAQAFDFSAVTQYWTDPGFKMQDTSDHLATWEGVYRLTLTFFVDGNYILLVRHNSTILNCYFESPHDPGHKLADSCTKQEVSMKTRITAKTNRIAAQETQDKTRRTNHLNTSSVINLYTTDNISLSIKSVFVKPDLRSTRSFLFWVPIIAAAVAALLQGFCIFFSYLLRYRFKRSLLDIRAGPYTAQSRGEIQLPATYEHRIRHQSPISLNIKREQSPDIPSSGKHTKGSGDADLESPVQRREDRPGMSEISRDRLVEHGGIDDPELPNTRSVLEQAKYASNFESDHLRSQLTKTRALFNLEHVNSEGTDIELEKDQQMTNAQTENNIMLATASERPVLSEVKRVTHRLEDDDLRTDVKTLQEQKRQGFTQESSPRFGEALDGGSAANTDASRADHFLSQSLSPEAVKILHAINLQQMMLDAKASDSPLRDKMATENENLKRELETTKTKLEHEKAITTLEQAKYASEFENAHLRGELEKAQILLELEQMKEKSAIEQENEQHRTFAQKVELENELKLTTNGHRQPALYEGKRITRASRGPPPFVSDHSPDAFGAVSLSSRPSRNAFSSEYLPRIGVWSGERYSRGDPAATTIPQNVTAYAFAKRGSLDGDLGLGLTKYYTPGASVPPMSPHGDSDTRLHSFSSSAGPMMTSSPNGMLKGNGKSGLRNNVAITLTPGRSPASIGSSKAMSGASPGPTQQRSDLQTIDGLLDLVTSLEDEKFISDQEAIFGRQLILREDASLMSVLHDVKESGEKEKIAACIRSLQSNPSLHRDR